MHNPPPLSRDRKIKMKKSINHIHLLLTCKAKHGLNFYLPSHVTPSPVYPILHMHVKVLMPSIHEPAGESAQVPGQSSISAKTLLFKLTIQIQ